MTRDEIKNLQPGDYIQRCYETRNGQPEPDARWSRPAKVLQIIFRGEDIHGLAYVGFYTEFGENGGRMSGDIKEGEGHVRIYTPPAPPTGMMIAAERGAAEKLAAFIRQHGLPAEVDDEGIHTVDEYSRDGQRFSEPITIAANRKAVRDFLGY